MTESGNDDPFFWDVERVVRELCSGDTISEPARLAEQLHFHEIDGEDLLIYADVLDSTNALPNELGLTEQSDRARVQVAIARLQARSPRYRSWKKSQEHEADPNILENLSCDSSKLRDASAIHLKPLQTTPKNPQGQGAAECPQKDKAFGHICGDGSLSVV
ncbi:hypothetical protein NKR23_g8996 [Pleurostoma richardsiae]|uniref:Uncharacterized protein n=1 Tax=Pleurostoma richardsiae TaxID=41990 RepID=A0AA38R6U7_9PEZI|nr:hypothetical protein NKR23_g8996 [Pleurostoma richardsiae]